MANISARELAQDLLARAVTVNRRLPYLWALFVLASLVSVPGQLALTITPSGAVNLLSNTLAFYLLIAGMIPKPIRSDLPI